MNDLIMTDDVPLTKRAIETTGRQYAERLLDRGERSPLAALIRLRAWCGVGFWVHNGRTYYDYSHDPTWVELKAAEKATAAARKRREQFLRGLDEAIVVRDTGGIVRTAKVAKAGRAVLALHFPTE